MKYNTRAKTTSTVESLLNWAEVSTLLTGGKDRIRKNRVPKVHKAKIQTLLSYLEAWKVDKKLFSEAQLSKAIDKIDLKTNLMVNISLLD